jgi:hypothetical protein
VLVAIGLDEPLRTELVGIEGLAEHLQSAIGIDLPGILFQASPQVVMRGLMGG